MPRRKQNCPKRMKWELENMAAAAAALGIKKDDDCGGSSDLTSDGDDEEKTGESGDGDFPAGGCSDSQDSHSSSSSKTSSPSLPSKRPNYSQSKQSSSPPASSESPLDLSVSNKKSDDEPAKKVLKWEDGGNHWNGSFASPDLTSKSLEKMSELSRVGQGDGRLLSPGNKGSSSSSWQAQWLAQSTCGTKDVLRCICCRHTFPTLSALSAHMKEVKHGPPLPNLPLQKGPPATSPISLPQAPSPSDPNLILKETVHLPRKLVRGQDVWLGKGAEQTRQILKCMWCGQSFRSLAEMTSHMQQTQHYTNIISQEQLISWRSSEDKTSPTNSHVSAVLTCKVCDQAFSSLKELSNHMVKNSHYKEHIMRSITESGSRRRQSREKRKKSLPVRKLLELERANSEMKKEVRISCEKCGEKISAPLFVEHLRLCEKSASAGGSFSASRPNKDPGKEPAEPAQDLSTKEKDPKKESSSVLNAIEKMIEKSFDCKRAKSHNSSAASVSLVGTSILKRLGIDESLDYTKPLVDSNVSGESSSGQSRPRSNSSEKSDDTAATSKTISKSPSPFVEPREVKSDSKSEQSTPPEKTNENHGGNSNSLNALSSMFQSIGGLNQEVKPLIRTCFQPIPHHPLAALQKLCDKTENNPVSTSSRPTSTSSSNAQSSPGVDSSSLLAVNWSTDGENVFKCTFCETTFQSKGAYRHHLAKMHFIKEKSPTTPAQDDAQFPSDSPTSKFIKYSELAKQLSSK